MTQTTTVDTSAASLEAVKAAAATPAEGEDANKTGDDASKTTEGDDADKTAEGDEGKKPESKKIPEGDDNAEGDDDAEVKNILETAGLSWDAVTDEFNEAGDLGEETRAKLEKAGFPKAMVDTYLNGIRAQIAEYDNAVYSAAGSPEQYAAMTAWAKANLSESDKKAFNAAVESGDVSTAKLAVEGLMARYAAGKNKTPNLKDGKSTNNGSVKPFASQAEVTQAMRDPRYKSDPSYREQVKERLAVSTVI